MAPREHEQTIPARVLGEDRLAARSEDPGDLGCRNADIEMVEDEPAHDNVEMRVGQAAVLDGGSHKRGLRPAAEGLNSLPCDVHHPRRKVKGDDLRASPDQVEREVATTAPEVKDPNSRPDPRLSDHGDVQIRERQHRHSSGVEVGGEIVVKDPLALESCGHQVLGSIHWGNPTGATCRRPGRSSLPTARRHAPQGLAYRATLAALTKGRGDQGK
jgi:hypothetical protein